MSWENLKAALNYLKWLSIWMIAALFFASVSVKPADAADFHVNIYGPVNHNHSGSLSLDIYEAKEGDTLYLNIGGPGGSVFHGMILLEALLETKARKVCKAEGMAASMSAIYLLACDELQAADTVRIMFHLPYRVDDVGKPMRTDHSREMGLELAQALGLDKILPSRMYLQYVAGRDVYIRGDYFAALFNAYKEAQRNAQ